MIVATKSNLNYRVELELRNSETTANNFRVVVRSALTNRMRSKSKWVDERASHGVFDSAVRMYITKK